MFLGRGTSGHQLQGLAAKAMALLHLEVNMGHDGIHGDEWYIYLTWIVDFVW